MKLQTQEDSWGIWARSTASPHSVPSHFPWWFSRLPSLAACASKGFLQEAVGEETVLKPVPLILDIGHHGAEKACLARVKESCRTTEWTE